MPDAATFGKPAAPYLSVVCAIGRTQRAPKWQAQTRMFLASTAYQATLNRLPVEIVLVDWSAQGDAPAADLLGALPHSEFVTYRIIEAPYAEMREGVPLDRERQAQNVGIRRARGEFVLATATDAVLSAGLIAHIAERKLSTRTFYYAFRFDTEPNAAEDIAPAEIEAICRRGVYAAGPSIYPVACAFDGESDAEWAALVDKAATDSELVRCFFPLGYCQGNFSLMARESWMELGGFPEWNVGDKHFDRMVMAQAHYRQWRKILLPWSAHYFSASRLRTYDLADDFYTDADGDLRIRVASPPIRHLADYHVINILIRLRRVFDEDPSLIPATIHLNGPNWGLAGHDLAERTPAAASV